MSSRIFSRRAALKVAAVVTASSLVLTGCSRGDNEDSANTGENTDARIASVGLGVFAHPVGAVEPGNSRGGHRA